MKVSRYIVLYSELIDGCFAACLCSFGAHKANMMAEAT